MEKEIRTIQEDEIDLKELFKTLWQKRVFIVVFTFIITVLGVVFAFTKTPIYEAKVVIEIGKINNSMIENTQNLIKKLKILYKDKDSEQVTKVTKINDIKKTNDLLEISVQSNSNESALEKLKEIISSIKKEHSEKIKLHKNYILKNIENLEKQKTLLESTKDDFEEKNKIKFELLSKIDNLKLEIADEKILETKILGKFITSKYPIKPKKKLIVVVSFVTGFILSIFLVFFIQFIKSFKEDENE